MPVQQWSEKIWVVKLSNEPALSDDLRPLNSRLEEMPTRPDLVIDLADVTQINSSNLSQLLRLRKMLSDANAQMRIVAPSDAIWSIFLTTGLDKLFAFSQDTATGLAELQLMPPPPPDA